VLIGLEIPKPHLETFSQYTDYDFALLHECLHDTHYKRFYREQALRGRVVMLDNGMWENGGQPIVDTGTWDEALDVVRPTVVIAPDVWEDYPATVSSTKKFTAWMHSRWPEVRVMGVVQGRTPTELRDCYLDLVKLGVDAIGWPTLKPDDSLSYQDRCRDAAKRRIESWENIWGKGASALPHHLLGYTDPVELGLYAGYANFVSMDTAKPFKWARAGIHRLGVLPTIEPAKKDLTRQMSGDESDDAKSMLFELKRLAGWKSPLHYPW